MTLGVGAMRLPLAAAQPADDAPTATPAPVATDTLPAGEAPAPSDEEEALEAELAAALASDAESTTSAARPTAGLASSMNPDLAFILDVAAAWFSEKDNLQTGGHDPTEAGFVLQQLELSIGKAVDPYFRFDGNLVFSQFGVEIEEAFATTLVLPHRLQVRAGQFLTRFGRGNATHPHSWDFVDQPFAIGRVFGGEGNRGLGVEASWLLPTSWYAELVASATDASGESTARSFFGANDLPVESPLDVQATISLKQFADISANWSLLGGVSFATGPNGTGHDNRTDVWGVDAFLKYRPITEASTTQVTLQTEWLLRRRQVPHALLADISGYAQATWRFAKRWGAGARYEYGSTSTAIDGVGSDDLDPAWTKGRARYSGALTFWATEFSRMRWQVSVDRPAWLAQPIFASFVALEVVVGAHGAHKF